MTKEKAEYCQIQIGPGGRKCACCAPFPKYLKRMEHRAARRNERKLIDREIQMDGE